MTPRPATGARLEVRDLTKRFGDFTAVEELDFAVEPGRITGFLGPNGAGKTTTLRMLLG
ncbi:MAG TPA: ATP-binding cassette domain-containing protein, partial [Lapillicoccus sp.]